MQTANSLLEVSVTETPFRVDSFHYSEAIERIAIHYQLRDSLPCWLRSSADPFQSAIPCWMKNTQQILADRFTEGR